MNQVQVRAVRPANTMLRPMVKAASMLLLLSVLGLVLFATFRSPLKDDIAWLLYVARRWMSGRELYVDVVEVNPPLIIWISAIPIELGRWFHIDAQFAAMSLFISGVLGCAWWGASLLRRPDTIFADRLPVFAAMGTVLLLVPGAELGQREHLLVAATLPYLILFAGSLNGERPAPTAAILAGVLAGLGCALKPRYAAVFAVLECLALTGGLRPWRLMPLAAGVTLATYAGLVALLCPAYLRRAVPLALALYGGTDVSFLDLLNASAILLAGEAVAVILWWLRRHSLPERNLMLTLIVFAATSTVICFVDGKDWYYHRLPASVVTVLALVLWAASELVHRHFSMRRLGLPLALAGVAVAVFGYVSIQHLEPEVEQAVEPQDTTVARLEQLVRSQHARTYIAFSEWIALGFPVVNNTGVAWASRFDSMWALKGELWRAHFDPTAARQWPIARWVVHDFIAGCPDIAVVDTREPTNYIGVLSATSPAFARAWSRYHLIDSFNGLAVYRRGKAGCVDSWVAAEAKPATEIR
jgi:hypothetical protein